MWMDGKTEHDGVAIIISRHEKPSTVDITGYGAGYAYLVGKLLSDYVGISYPEHIFYSPIARARHTAKMHELAMKVNDIIPPTMSYNASFHESASKEKVQEAFDDALTYAEAKGLKTIEIVAHEPTLDIITRFLADRDCGEISYGAALIIKANSWQDIRERNCDADLFMSSHKFAEAALGKEQVELLDELMHRGNQTGRENLSPDLSERQKKQITKAEKWFEDVAGGQKPESRYSPIEYLEVFDAYKAWVDMSMSAIGINPNQQGFLYSELYQKLRKDNPEFESFEKRVDAGDRNPENESFGVFEAVAKLITKGKGSQNDENLEKMEDFPMYRDITLAGEGRILNKDKEEKADRTKSYRITQKEQLDHDQIAAVVRDFKKMHR